MDKCIVPLSGGLDSTVIYHLARSKGYEIQAVGYDYGQKHRDKELICAQKTIHRTKQENLKKQKQMLAVLEVIIVILIFRLI